MQPSRIVKSAHRGRPEPLKTFAFANVNSSNHKLADACKAWLTAKGLLPRAEGKAS